jgi:phospholipid/cholesterol/gamma-HCH transport system ATP-binding protein
MDPIVIFYDEPTSGLDPTSASHIQDLIYTAHSSQAARTSVIITHDKDLLSRLEPRVVLVNEGKLAFDGPFQEFHASDSPIVRPYFELMPMLHGRTSNV